MQRFHGGWSIRTPDAAAVVTLACATTLITWIVTGDAAAYIRGDWPTLFLPIYAFLGERLRAFDLPGWNPHQFSGAPFAGDPSSGWGYLLAMLFYTLLPALAATTLFVASHVVLSALAAYALARLSGLAVGGAFVAGAAYAFPWLIPSAAGMVLFFQVHAWLPIALIGIELALRPGRGSGRFGGIVLSGLAISQLLAAWLGQGSYYALLVIGGWVAWRTLATPPRGWTVRQRIAGLLGIGVGSLLVGVALNAMALLVRLDANSRSNIPGGVYSGVSRWADSRTGRNPDEIVQALAGGFSEASWRYAGAAVLVLALLAPVVAPRWPPLVFWLATSATAIALAIAVETPVHTVMATILPRFEVIHGHVPGRVLMVLPLAAAMLAGATADRLARPGLPALTWSRALPLLPIAVLAVGAVALERREIMSGGSLAAAIATLALCTVALAVPIAFRTLLIPLALTAIVIWDPAARAIAVGWGPAAGPQRSLRAALGDGFDGFLDGNGGAAFLSDATRTSPGRYAGYDPSLLPIEDVAASNLPRQAYRNHWLGPANWLLVQNWATWFALDDVQGYNPIQVGRYTEYINALNGHPQEYHETDVFPAGLASPLLPPLNLRYLVAPADAPARDEFASLIAAMSTVYDDDQVRILENRDAYPRAWLVHEARQVGAGQALALLADGAIDPRRTALLEAAPPALGIPADSDDETAVFVVREPDRIIVDVWVGAPALMMVSENWDPGWNAMIDGAPVPVLLANHTFQAVAVPEGPHTVEIYYDPPGLRLGLAITSATALILVVVWASLRRREQSASSVPEDAG